MEIWPVYETDYDGGLVGLFSSKEKADAWVVTNNVWNTPHGENSFFASSTPFILDNASSYVEPTIIVYADAEGEDLLPWLYPEDSIELISVVGESGDSFFPLWVRIEVGTKTKEEVLELARELFLQYIADKEKKL